MGAPCRRNALEAMVVLCRANAELAATTNPELRLAPALQPLQDKFAAMNHREADLADLVDDMVALWDDEDGKLKQTFALRQHFHCVGSGEPGLGDFACG